MKNRVVSTCGHEYRGNCVISHGLFAFAVCLLLMFAITASAEIKIASVFGDGMVIQRDTPVPVWGVSAPGDEVTVSFAGQTKNTQANADGSWSITLEPIAASSDSQELLVGSTLSGTPLKIANVLVGDVWLCGGQSNMGLYLKESFGAREAIDAANYPQIRLRAVPAVRSSVPVELSAGGNWTVCTPETAADFAAVAYHFGRVIHEASRTPIGLIEFDRGATGIEGWATLAGLEAMPNALTQQLYREAASWDPNHPLGRAAHESAFQQIREWIPAAKAALAEGRPVPPEPLIPAPLLTVPGPTELFNGTVRPLVPFAIKGVIWYQGESNPGEGPSYEEKMIALVRGWRGAWGRGDFPFYWVQLANEGNPAREPDQESTFRYVPVREAQRRVLREPNTGMVVAIDLGEDANGHPRNKKEVAERLALWSLAKDYGHATPFSGPLYKSHRIEGDRVIVSFDHVGGGLMVGDKEGHNGLGPVRETPNAPLGHFAVSGEDGEWHWAEARIAGDEVQVWCAAVPSPRNIRYAYSMNPKGPKLYNREGLPASPFSTAW